VFGGGAGLAGDHVAMVDDEESWDALDGIAIASPRRVVDVDLDELEPTGV